MRSLNESLILVYVIIFFLFSNPAISQEVDWWEANKPETKYLTQLALADSMQFLNEFEYPFRLVLSREEKKDYSKIVSQLDRKFYIRNYIKNHDQNPLLPVNYWLLEFLGRYEYARQEFGIEEPPYFDVRGEFYIKYGKPWRRFEDLGGYKESWYIKFRSNPGIRNPAVERLLGLGFYSGGIAQPMETAFKVRQNESWSYHDDNNIFFIHFMKEGKNWIHIDRLEKVMVDGRSSKRRLHWIDLIKERQGIGGLYTMMNEEIEWMEELLQDLVTLATANMEISMPYTTETSVLSFTPGGSVDRLKTNGQLAEKVYLNRAVPNVNTRFDE